MPSQTWAETIESSGGEPIRRRFFENLPQDFYIKVERIKMSKPGVADPAVTILVRKRDGTSDNPYLVPSDAPPYYASGNTCGGSAFGVSGTSFSVTVTWQATPFQRKKP